MNSLYCVQARERARLAGIIKRARQAEDRRVRAGVTLSHEEAACRIQAHVRGWLWRRRIQRESDKELVFIGMKPKPRDTKRDPLLMEAKNLMRRKRVQLEAAREYDDAIVNLKSKVREMEGQDMREVIQDKVNAWFVENRNPETGEYPDFPDADDGGSKLILNPPPPPLDSLLEEEDPKAKGKDGKGKADPKKDAKGKGKGEWRQAGRQAGSEGVRDY